LTNLTGGISTANSFQAVLFTSVHTQAKEAARQGNIARTAMMLVGKQVDDIWVESFEPDMAARQAASIQQQKHLNDQQALTGRASAISSAAQSLATSTTTNNLYLSLHNQAQQTDNTYANNLQMIQTDAMAYKARLLQDKTNSFSSPDLFGIDSLLTSSQRTFLDSVSGKQERVWQMIGGIVILLV